MSDASDTTTRLEVLCPCCESLILVDRATGVIISHTEKRDAKGPGSIGDILSGLAEKKASSERLFEREMSSMKDRARLLDEKLQEAVRKAKESGDEKPLRPIDLE
ncbi:MAG TPA: 2-nitropropane dioxygenase [Blastocatellia bacterium]|nr:2-nitropropane dioxygenase [Blastocatellia bacterium]